MTDPFGSPASQQPSLEQMKAELERIRLERERLHQEMRRAAEAEPAKPRSSKVGGILIVLASLSALVLGVVLFVRATRLDPMTQRLDRFELEPLELPPPLPHEPEPAIAEEEPQVEEEPVRRPRRPPRGHSRMGLEGIEDCGDDPLCGL